MRCSLISECPGQPINVGTAGHPDRRRTISLQRPRAQGPPLTG
ncbi:hypothetical protein BN844_3705 [Pseudomonas sp. SHC52]|nr:hypothetical protein BN844_3705 [Pseudomonas sp. SHC52]